MKYPEAGKGRAGGRVRRVRHSPPGAKLKGAPKKSTSNQDEFYFNAINF